MKRSFNYSRWFAWIDAAVALLFALLFARSIYAANAAAAEAVRLYGRNVDSGALLYAAAVVYMAPAAFGFGLASLSMFLTFRFRWVVHGLPVALAAGPALFLVADALLK